MTLQNSTLSNQASLNSSTDEQSSSSSSATSTIGAPSTQIQSPTQIQQQQLNTTTPTSPSPSSPPTSSSTPSSSILSSPTDSTKTNNTIILKSDLQTSNTKNTKNTNNNNIIIKKPSQRLQCEVYGILRFLACVDPNCKVKDLYKILQDEIEQIYKIKLKILLIKDRNNENVSSNESNISEIFVENVRSYGDTDNEIFIYKY
ncbi:hypothetical protein CYY_009089 [Polysphondylium violaceum]|uniref:Uncharacterized protein n=1 Tax=Polysphondylium violaceum TaxID=133409 RepID=A0A8J4UWI4_9MYCE|nr:hypothetical protein CYY_009089 [Polysphondylium violaceum]